jgi:hypothetical protein
MLQYARTVLIDMDFGRRGWCRRSNTDIRSIVKYLTIINRIRSRKLGQEIDRACARCAR